jgi:hypothetical protein
VPLLAVVAYARALSVGFLGDDFVLLAFARLPGVDWSALLPHSPHWPSYRPVGVLLTWELGWALWGANPLPYHLVSLLIHAATALLLGLWLADATRAPLLGWLAGALFAVFPIHTEAVAWVAAQWDEWAALFGLAGLALFTAWWRRAGGPGGAGLYAGALIGYTLSIFAKESTLAFLPVFAAAAWLAAPPAGRVWPRLGLALVPFGAVLALNVGLRLAVGGTLGAYQEASTDYVTFFWTELLNRIRILLAPLNPAVAGEAAVQIVGALTSLGLLLGLMYFGYRQRAVLAVAGLWIVLTLAPILNLGMQSGDLENNRFFYLPIAGYCVVLAALITPALRGGPARRGRPGRGGPAASGGHWRDLGRSPALADRDDHDRRGRAGDVAADPAPSAAPGDDLVCAEPAR